MASFGRSILILAPHPDDEVVGFSAAIGRAQAAGAVVRVIFLTHGCVERDAMWPWERGRYESAVATRWAEAEAACALLGLEAVGWSDRPARHLWRSLDNAESDVRAVLANRETDQIWTPAFEGGNPDHDGTNALAHRLADDGHSVLEFAEYNWAGGKVRSHAFPTPNGSEEILTLTEAERARKREALAAYASERGNLGYVGVEREAFRPLASYDYARPPHPGKLWYARFQWVPFRHPMIDFTRPEAVSAALSAYQARTDSDPLTSR